MVSYVIFRACISQGAVILVLASSGLGLEVCVEMCMKNHATYWYDIFPVHRQGLSGEGRCLFPPQEDMFPPQNNNIMAKFNGNYTGIALFLITLQVHYGVWVLKAGL